MCGIAGFCNFTIDYSCNQSKFVHILDTMADTLYHRGPDDRGTYLSRHIGLAHSRLAIIDLANGNQPMYRSVGGFTYAISYNGELYNMKEIKKDLSKKGWRFKTNSDTEVILLAYIEYGPDFVKQLNGIFAFAIADERLGNLILYRDHNGVKPLYYTTMDQTLLFGSELKAIFSYPSFKPEVTIDGLNEVFSIGPAKTRGNGVFHNVFEVMPGQYLIVSEEKITRITYWKLKSRPHTDSYEDTIEKTRYLITDSIKRQMISDVSICTFLSGGLDSSFISSVCASELQKEGKQLQTYSFDFINNDKYFQSNAYQPESDKPYATEMANYLNSTHTYLECYNLTMADYLYDSVNARDLPAMADIDSSMLYFCQQVKHKNKVALTGECADEIFGGYPWFHDKDCFSSQTFPWSRNIDTRKVMLSDSFLQELNMEEYILSAYQQTIDNAPRLKGEDEVEARRREISYLNIVWFMQTLLDRMDHTSMYSGLEARVPFADYRIVDYVFNVPWEMKNKNNLPKNLLRQAGRGLLPESVLFRTKSPYPKTYDPSYENLIKERFIHIIENPNSPIRTFIDKKKAYQYMNSPSNYTRPWYGQLMAGPQMLAYMIQINYWLSHYHIHLL